jgi:hypothetical protein
MRKAKLKTNVMTRDQASRADLFLMHEGFNKPVEGKNPVAPTMINNAFVADFHRTYTRLPATYKNHSVDQGVEIIKIGVMAQLLDELRSLTQELKTRLST